jgi:hypothetical protein
VAGWAIAVVAAKNRVATNTGKRIIFNMSSPDKKVVLPEESIVSFRGRATRAQSRPGDGSADHGTSQAVDDSGEAGR